MWLSRKRVKLEYCKENVLDYILELSFLLKKIIYEIIFSFGCCRNFTQKLPDKGEKIKELLEKLTQELEKRRSQSSSEDTNRDSQTFANNSQISNDDIENTFERLQIDNSNDSDVEKPKHMFEIAEERARQNVNDMRIVTRLNQ